MLERTFDELLKLGLVFAILAIILVVVFHLWQKSEAARIADEKAWQAEFKEQEIRHAEKLKELTDENKGLNKARLDSALDMLAFVKSMEDAIKKGDVSKAIDELKSMVKKIAKHQNVDVD